MNNKMFMLLIAIALVMLGLLALRFQPTNCEAHTLDQFENLEQVCKGQR